MASTLYAMGVQPQAGSNTGTANGAGGGAALFQFMPLVIIFALFYFLLIRPQQKQAKQKQEMVKALKPGDQVVTASGIYGTVNKINDDDTIILKVADNVNLKIARAAIDGVAKK